MGGFGSGRFGETGLVESCIHLDVNHLNRAGHLQPGSKVILRWERGDIIGLRAGDGRVVLSYGVRSSAGAWSLAEAAVAIAWIPCEFGGARPYFRCPGKPGRACQRRVTKIHFFGGQFLCRHCHDLAYTSQSETRLDRLQHRARKSTIALGGEPGEPGTSFPPRPKGMHKRTYERRLADIRAARAEQRQSVLAFARRQGWIN